MITWWCQRDGCVFLPDANNRALEPFTAFQDLGVDIPQATKRWWPASCNRARVSVSSTSSQGISRSYFAGVPCRRTGGLHVGGSHRDKSIQNRKGAYLPRDFCKGVQAFKDGFPNKICNGYLKKRN